jgi:hypothetical protein
MTMQEIQAAFAKQSVVRHRVLEAEVHVVGVAYDNEITPGGLVLLDWDGDGELRWWADPAEVEALAA